MRFMVIVKATKDSEAGVMPEQKLLADMGNFNEELVKAGEKEEIKKEEVPTPVPKPPASDQSVQKVAEPPLTQSNIKEVPEELSAAT